MKGIKDRPYLLLTMAVFFWAGNFILGRAFHSEIPPVALAFWRWVGSPSAPASSLPRIQTRHSRIFRDDVPDANGAQSYLSALLQR